MIGSPFTKYFSIQKANSNIVLKVDQKDNTYFYGDEIKFTVSLAINPSDSKASTNVEIDLYCNDIYLQKIECQAAENFTEVSGSTIYSTIDKKIPLGKNTITAVYNGGGNLNNTTGMIELTILQEINETGKDFNYNVLKNQEIFLEPSFYGINGEQVTGTFGYSYNGKTSYKDVVAELAKLDEGAFVNVGYTFFPNGNYTGTISGILNITVVDIQFIGIESALQIKDMPVYGDKWGEILIYNPSLLTARLNGKEIYGNFNLIVDNANYNPLGQPDAGTYTYKILFSATSDTNFQNVEVCSGTITVSAAKLDDSSKILIIMEDNNYNGVLDSGDRLTVDTSAVTPTGSTMNYQWQKTVYGVTSIVGTDSISYTLTNSDNKGKLFCTVNFSGNVIGTKTSNSIDIAKEILTGNIAINGNPYLNEILTVSTPTNNGITNADYTITWLKDGTAIVGANQTVYTITKYDLDKSLKVAITANESSEYFTGSLISSDFYIPATAPEKPVIRLESGYNSVNVSWETPFNNGSDITGYKLLVKQSGTEIASSPIFLGAETKSYNVDGLTKGKLYDFILVAENKMGSTASDQVSAIINASSDSSSSEGSSGNSSVAPIKPESMENPDLPIKITTTITPTITDKTENIMISKDTVNQVTTRSCLRIKKVPKF